VADARSAGADERADTTRPHGRDGEVTRLLFVCLGNICRSPTAEGVMRALVEQAGMSDRIELDSAGTGAWHVGNAPDTRAVEAASARGFALDGRARQIRPEDFDDFDLMIAMDSENVRELRRLAPGRGQPSRPLAQLVAGEMDVPDPYYGGEGGFEQVLDLVQAACAGLLEQIESGRAP
jgi:protein-tyrosine phosphatase